MKISRIFESLTRKLGSKPKSYFIHIGKTGGSAIVFALKGHTKAHDYILKFNGHKTKLTDIPIGEKFFFCVRDPIDRFVSGFYSRQRQGRPKYNSPWRKEEKVAFETFKTPNELALALSSENATFKSQAEYAMNSIAHVKTSYWDWFISEAYLKKRSSDILFICHQQNLNEDFLKLKKVLGIPEFVKLPDKSSEAAHANPIQSDKKLDALAIKNLEQWYSKEYSFLEILKDIQNKASK